MDQRANFGTALDLSQRAAGLFAQFLPGHEFQEAQNKIEAFRLFAYVDDALNLPPLAHDPAPHESLPAAIRRAAALGAYKSIWALEGLAHRHTDALLPSSSHLSGLLTDPAIPETSMVPMHAGMGTACAGYLLNKLPAAPTSAALHDTVRRFLDFCTANSRTGWFDNAAEPLGLAVRSLHPHLLRQMSDAAAAIDPHAATLYWHGVGRSLYFVPSNFATFGNAHARAIQSALDEAPTPEARRNAVAGLVWAIVLVNIRHAAVLRNLLRATRDIAMPEALINGIVSALMVWKHMVPADAAFLPPYLRLASSSDADDHLWNDRVAIPALRAFAETYPDLLSHHRIATLFSYRGLHE